MQMPQASDTHILLIPSYNTGLKLTETVSRALEVWSPVWVVVDGSSDGSDKNLGSLQAAALPGALRILRLPRNSGKGAAILHGTRQAIAEGFTHVLTMDADGQHSSAHVRRFMDISRLNPHALVLGVPQFDEHAPSARVRGRRIANWWARLETQSDVGDCLFGFRVYPAKALLAVLEETTWARRFDFDPEVAVRLIWRGHEALNVPAPCRYFTREEGGVSHFNYVRDNLLLSWMFLRLFFGFLPRLPKLIHYRLRSKATA